MKAWSTWFPDLLPHVAGCPTILAEFELRRAAQAFFELSRAWQVTQALKAVTAGTQTVTVTPDDTTQEMVRVEQGYWDGTLMRVKALDELDMGSTDDWTLHTGTPSIILQLTPGVITLYPIPDAAASTGLKLRLSVRPSETSTGLPDEMAVKFRDTITAGAKARLMLYPGKAWTNPDLAVVAAGQFEAGASKANINATRAYGHGRVASRPNWC